MLILSFAIIIIYIFLIGLLLKGWKKIPTFHFSQYPEPTSKLTVVVACKNEEKNLPQLLYSLKEQTFKHFQLILVDDNSTDNTWQILQNAQSDFSDIKILQSAFCGKKRALKTGIEQADNDLIVTTDADCTPTPYWLETIAKFEMATDASLIIGSVSLNPVNSFFEKLQQLEFLSLISSGAGATGIKNAIMCNGANMAFKRELWLNNYQSIKENLNSGDDVFFLHSLKKTEKKILFLKSKESIVETFPCKDLSSFFKQRKRWVSKAPAYNDFMTIGVASLIFIVAALQIILLIASFSDSKFFYGYLLILMVKLLMDFLFLKNTSTFFGQKITAHTIIPLAVIYPFYIIIVSFSGLLSGLKTYR